MKKIAGILTTLIVCMTAIAQNVGIGTTQPHTSAALELQSNSKGLLIPRMSTSQRKNIATPATGLLVFDTDKGTIYMFDGLQWLPLTGSVSDLFMSSRTSNTPSNYAGMGHAVSISGSYAIVSSKKDYGATSYVDTAFIFFKTDGNWTFQAKLVQSDAVAGDDFGSSVAISNDQALVGAPRRNSYSGAVYAYSRTGTVWTQTAIITASPVQAGSQFGCEVSINGLHAMIGANNFKNAANVYSGTVFCYYRNAGGWLQTQQLFGISTLTGFGSAIDISGTCALVGSPDADYNGVNSTGIAYFYKRTGLTWSAADTIYNDGGAALENFGSSVTLDETQNWAFIGIPGRFAGNNSGAVKGYTINSNSLTARMYIMSPSYGYSPESGFGSSISMYNDILVIGAPQVYNDDAGKGRVYIYKYDGTYPNYGDRWPHWKTIKDIGNYSSSFYTDKIGHAVMINGHDIVIGNPGANHQQGKVLFLNVE